MRSPIRRVARWQLLLGADTLLSRAESAWVSSLGLRYRNDGRHVDPLSGRTSLEQLRQSGIRDRVQPVLQDALDQGADPETLSAEVAKAMATSGASLAESLRHRAPQMLRDHWAARRGMARRTRAIWGPALDAYFEVYICAEELGSDLQQMHAEEDDRLVEALLGLHARTCLVLSEVHGLLSLGYPLGSWARARTLHETAVIATLLQEHGREPGTEDLAERYLEHAIVDAARDFELAISAGASVPVDELERRRQGRAAVTARYGRMFAKDYGWARPLFPAFGPKERVTFEHLELLAQTGLNRLDYRLGGHHVHASAWTVELNRVSRAGSNYRLTGPTNVGFGAPAEVALAAGIASTSALVLGIETDPEPMHIIGLHAMRSLVDEAVGLFGESQSLVERREARLQTRGLTTKGNSR